MIKAKDAKFVVLMLEAAIDFTTQGYDPGPVLEMLVDDGEDHDHPHSLLRSKYPALRQALVERAQELRYELEQEQELQEAPYADQVL